MHVCVHAVTSWSILCSPRVLSVFLHTLASLVPMCVVMRGFVLLYFGCVAGSGCPRTGLDTFVTSSVADQPAWYRSLVYCAFMPSMDVPSDLYDCLNNGSWVGPNRPLSTHLKEGFAGSPAVGSLSGCWACAFDFAIAVHALRDSDEVCAVSPGVYTSDSLLSSACQRLLYEPISAFNVCANNRRNLVTALSSTRCVLADFLALSEKYTSMMYTIGLCSFAGSGQSVSDVSLCVGGVVADYRSAECGSCMENLLVTVISFSSSLCVSGSSYSFVACRAEMMAASEEFGVCSGGMDFAVNGDPCLPSDARAVVAMRPYKSLMTCSLKSVYLENTCWRRLSNGRNLRVCRRLAESINIEECLAYYNSIELAVSSVCIDHLSTFMWSVLASPAGCTGRNFFTSDCLSIVASVGGSVFAFGVSAGAVLSTDSTACSVSEWASLSVEQKSFAPFVRCGLRSSSVDETLDCAEEFAPTISCNSCFLQLGIEAFVEAQFGNPLARIACADLYSLACLKAMNKPLLLFTDCAGGHAEIVGSGQCTLENLASLEAEGAGLSALLSLVASTSSPTSASFLFTEKFTFPEIPCVFCFSDLMDNLFSLSQSDRSLCTQNFYGWNCYMRFGPQFNQFQKCVDGWSSLKDFIVPFRTPFIPIVY